MLKSFSEGISEILFVKLCMNAKEFVVLSDNLFSNSEESEDNSPECVIKIEGEVTFDFHSG